MAQPKWYNPVSGQWEPLTVGVKGDQGPMGPSGFVAQPFEPSSTDVLWLDTDEPSQNHFLPPGFATDLEYNNKVVGDEAWLHTPAMGYASVAPSSTSGNSSRTICGSRIFVPTDCVVNAISFGVHTAADAGAYGRLAIYEDDPPKSLPKKQAPIRETGDIDIGTPGTKVGAIADLFISGGTYVWVGFQLACIGSSVNPRILYGTTHSLPHYGRLKSTGLTDNWTANGDYNSSFITSTEWNAPSGAVGYTGPGSSMPDLTNFPRIYSRNTTWIVTLRTTVTAEMLGE